MRFINNRSIQFALVVAACIFLLLPTRRLAAQGQKPNILFIMGDDIGWYNTSLYNRGDMGYSTPNIDRIGKEGAMFLSWYGQQSCTAGRAAFITGQSPIRTGLTKVGMPGADVGLSAKDLTVADVMRSLGYSTAQFGKNHVGDRNEFLPCVHGFDEFFGNLYHLNAEEEPEDPDYPKAPIFRERFGPRGVLHCWATTTDDPTEDKSFGRVGRQKIDNTGPLNTKRMETVDTEFADAAMNWMETQVKASKPFFCYFNSTRMHVWTHLKPSAQGKTGLGIYPDGMVEHDAIVGQLLKKLEDLGVAKNTIVVYTTDNGAEVMTWPDGGSTPYRGEKATNWEGGYRVPTMIRWPGVIQPGTIYNEFFAHEDFIPTFAAAAGNPDIVAQCKETCKLGDKSFHVHLDGYNLLPFFQGQVESPRKEFLYWSDDGDLFALRYQNWKVVFIEQNHAGMDIWMQGFNKLRIPKVFNLRSDPFERGDSSILYPNWHARHLYITYGAQGIVAAWLKSFKDFPIRQKPASFNLDEVMRKLGPTE
jgi:arylsulfatase A-like enzyme